MRSGKKNLQALMSMVPKEKFKQEVYITYIQLIYISFFYHRQRIDIYLYIICQGEKQFIELLGYIHDQTAYRKGKATKSALPVVVKTNIPAVNIDKKLTSDEGEAPKLFLFYNENNCFELAEVVADTKVIHLQASNLTQAIVSFIGCYWVFHVGYPKSYSQFLGFVQAAICGLPYDGPKSMGYVQLYAKFEKEMENMKEKSQFKKLCV